MSHEVVQRAHVRRGSRIPVTLDFSAVAARSWRAGASYAAATRIRPTRLTGFEFEAENEGQTGVREPKWPKALEGTVQDGSISWIAREVTTDSLRKVLTVVEWDGPEAVTITGETFDNAEQTATAYLEPSAAGIHEVVVWASFSDNPSHREGFAIQIEAV